MEASEVSFAAFRQFAEVDLVCLLGEVCSQFFKTDPRSALGAMSKTYSAKLAVCELVNVHFPDPCFPLVCRSGIDGFSLWFEESGIDAMETASILAAWHRVAVAWAVNDEKNKPPRPMELAGDALRIL